MRSSNVEQLLANPSSFIVLTCIAYRAKRDPSELDKQNLDLGEAKVGDYKSLGLTRQKYRAAIDNLKQWGLITTKTTNRGTIAKLANTTVFDINLKIDNQQNNQQKSVKNSNQQNNQQNNHQDNQQTTNKTTNKENVENVENPFDLEDEKTEGSQQDNQQITNKATSEATNKTTTNKNKQEELKKKKTKAKKEKSFFVSPPSWVDSDLWEDFMEVRARNKKGTKTEASANGLIRQLARMREEGYDPNRIIENSIAGGWTGVFKRDECRVGVASIDSDVSEEQKYFNEISRLAFDEKMGVLDSRPDSEIKQYKDFVEKFGDPNINERVRAGTIKAMMEK